MTSDIAEFIDGHEAMIAPLYKDYSLKFWELSLDGSETNARALVEAKARFLSVYSDKEDFQKLRMWRSAARDLPPIAARQFKLIYDAYVPYQIDEAVLREIVERETEIENQFNNYRANFEGANASDNQLRDVLRNERNMERRKAAWSASKQVGQLVAPKLLDLVRIRNREAEKLGYSDYYSMMFELQELDEQWVFTILERLDASSDEAFGRMKSRLDGVLKERYGDTETANFPWLYSDPFFQEFPSTGANEVLDDIFKSHDIQALTKAHYASIGIDIDDLLKRADLYEREGKSQHAFCLDVDRNGDVRVLCNIRANERWMSTMLHEFGHAIYDQLEDPSLPFTLRTPAHILSTEAIAMMNGRMSKDADWLTQIAGVPPAEARRLSSQVFEILRSEMLIFLRWAITLVRFERELYRNPEQDLNRLWWENVRRIQKVTPPPNRDQPDWAAKIHLSSSPVYYQNYVLGELMASQLLSYIRRSVSGSDAFAGNHAVGKYLIERVFRSGARLRWDEMLERATGESLNPQHFVLQFVGGGTSLSGL